MATLQVSTASNAPTVDPDRVVELHSFLDEWLLGTGPFDELTVDVHEPDQSLHPEDESQPSLILYGYALFGPAHRPTVREAAREQLDADGDLNGLNDGEREDLIDDEAQNLVYDYQHEHSEDFLRELATFLTEPFVVQTAGYEKCRFPLVGYQYSVDPEGEIGHVSFG